MSITDLFPLHPRPHTDPTKARRAAEMKAKMIAQRATELGSLARALQDIATSGDSDENMTEAANILIRVTFLRF